MQREVVDPIQEAVGRGSKALDFINAPLVLDYVRLTFSCTLPHWLSRHPFNYDINAGFYKYFPVHPEAPGYNGDSDAETPWSFGALLRYEVMAALRPGPSRRYPWVHAARGSGIRWCITLS